MNSAPTWLRTRKSVCSRRLSMNGKVSSLARGRWARSSSLGPPFPITMAGDVTRTRSKKRNWKSPRFVFALRKMEIKNRNKWAFWHVLSDYITLLLIRDNDTYCIEDKHWGKLDQTVQRHVLEETEWCYKWTPPFPDRARSKIKQTVISKELLRGHGHFIFLVCLPTMP